VICSHVIWDFTRDVGVSELFFGDLSLFVLSLMGVYEMPFNK
jgi:hypothetical protein